MFSTKLPDNLRAKEIVLFLLIAGIFGDRFCRTYGKAELSVDNLTATGHNPMGKSLILTRERSDSGEH